MTLWLPDWLVWLLAGHGALCLAYAVGKGVLRGLRRVDDLPPPHPVGAPSLPPEAPRRSLAKDEPQPAPAGRPTKG
jgi:hypothetical protein